MKLERPSLARSVKGAERSLRRAFDGNERQAETAGRLVADFAARLGLDAAEVRLDLGAGARATVGRHGGRGLMRDGVAFLDPSAFDPSTAAGRALLAHEMTHLAQRAERGPGRGPGRGLPDLPAAEAEAREMGRRAAALQPLGRPRAVLPFGVAAADGGIRPQPSTGAAALGAEPESAARMLGQIETRATALTDRMRGDRDEVMARLDGIVWDSDVTRIMRILDTYEVADAAALIRSLRPDRRGRIVGETDGTHYRNYGRSVIAAYAGLVSDHAEAFGRGNFDEIDYAGLQGRELIALDLVLGELQRLRPRFAAELLRSNVGEVLARRMADPFGSPQPERRPGEESGQEEAADEALSEADLAVVRQVIGQARALLGRDASSAGAERVLELVRPHAPLVEPAPRSGTRPDHGDEGAALDEVGGALRTVPPILLRIAEEMAAANLLDPLLEHTDRAVALDPRNAGLFFALIAHRPVWKNLEYVESLLSTGFLDWAVRDYEAEYAYRLLRAMPLDAQYRFRHAEGGRFWRRLEREIPIELIRSGVYIGIEVTRGEDGSYTSTAGDYAHLLESGAGAVDAAEVLRWVEDNRGSRGWKQELFAQLSRIAREGGDPHPSPLLSYVVRRLDTLGALKAMIDGLPDEFLFQADRRAVFDEILMARDEIHLREHAADLMSTAWPVDTAVTDRDAWVAFRLVRALPLHEQEAFLRRNDGEDFAAIWNELHARMRTSRDTHLFVSRDGGLNREDIRARLGATEADQNLWTAARRHELDAQVRLAIGFGLYDFVFAESRRREAWRIEALAPVIERYRLYDARPGHERTAPDADELPTSALSGSGAFEFLQPLGRALLYALPTITTSLDLLFFGTDFLLSGRGGGYRIDLERAMRLARIATDTTMIEFGHDDPDREERAEGENTASIWFELGSRQMHIALPSLRISRFNHMIGGTRVDMGPISLNGLHIVARYGDDAFTEAVSVEGHTDELKIDSGGIAGPGSALAFGALSVRPLDLSAGMEGENDSVAGDRPRGAFIPLPFVFPMVIGLLETLSHLGHLSDSNTYRNFTALDLSFDRLDVQGFATDAGVRLQALAIRDFDLGIATTPVQYAERRLEQARRHLAALSEAERSGEAGATLRAQIATLEGSLDQARTDERERVRLKRQYEADPDAMEDRDIARLVALERARSVGVTLDIGMVDATGIRSPVDVDHISLRGISGHGEGRAAMQLLAAAGFDRLADPATLASFRDRLDAEAPPANGVPTRFDGGLNLQIAALEAEGVGFTYVPGVSTLEMMIAIVTELAARRPQEPRFVETRERLLALVAPVTRYHELSRHPERLPLSERRELGQLRRQLREAFYIRVESIEATDARVGIGVTPREARLSVGAGSFTVENIRGLGIEIGRIEGRDVDLGIGLLIGMLQEVFHGRREAGADLVSSVGAHAGRLTATGVNAELFGFRADEIDVQGLEAEVTRDGDLIGITISQLRSLSLSNFALRSGDQSIVAPGRVALQDAPMDLLVRTRVATDASGEESLQLAGVLVSGTIGRLAYDGEGGPLVYEGPAPESLQAAAREGAPRPPARRMRAEVHHGALGGITFTDFTVDLTREQVPWLHGRVQVQSIDSLRIAGLVREAFQSPEGREIVTHRLEGTVSGGSTPGPEAGDAAAAGPAAAALDVSFLQGSMTRLGFNDIDLTDGLVMIGNNEVTIRSLDNLDGDIGFSGNDIVIHGLSFDRIELADFRWRTEGGTELAASGTAVANAFSLRGRVTRENGKLTAVRVDGFHVDALTAAHFRYRDPARNITLSFDNSRPGGPSHQPVEVRDLTVTGLDWSSANTLPTSGHVELGQLDAIFDASFGRRFAAQGNASVRGLALDFHAGDRVVAQFRDLDARAHVTSGTTQADIEIESARTGDTGRDGSVEYRHGQGMTLTRLRVGSFTVPALNFDSPRMAIQIPEPAPAGSTGPVPGPLPPSHVRLEEVKLSAAIDFQQSDHADAPPVQEIRITELEIPTIRARGIAVTLKDYGAVLTLPAADEATVTNVVLSARPGESAFVVRADFDAATGATSWLVNGLLSTGAIDVPRLQADVAGAFTAEAAFHVDTVSGEFFGAGAYQVDLNAPSLTALGADLARILPSATLRMLGATGTSPGALSADRVRLTQEGLKVLNPRGGPFELTIPDKGITLTIGEFTGTPEIAITYAEPVPAGTPGVPPGATDMVVSIPEASVRNARIAIDDLSALMGPSSGPGGLAGLAALSTDYAALLDSANGHVNLDFRIPRRDPTGATTPTPIAFPVRIPIVGGNADINGLIAALAAEVERLAAETPWVGGATVILSSVRGEVDPDSVNIQMGNTMYEQTWGVTSPEGWVTLVEFDLRDPPAGTVPTGVTLATVPVRALLRIVPRVGAPPTSAGGPVSDPMELNNIDVELSFTHAAPFPLPFGTPGAAVSGTATLAPRSLAGVSVTGSLGAGGTPAGPGYGTLNFDVNRAVLQSLNMAVGGGTLTTGQITVSDPGGGDGVRGFVNLEGFTPRRIEAEGINLHLLDIVFRKRNPPPAAGGMGP